ncbi:hypothetical protein M4791_12845 [Klebsiella pneumoniae subsp. pneumoniae]|uniref:SLAC1 family transporter n=4 Tax=Klebsiella TaxID=570 RepID=UPI00217E6047|nr:hypothetical protein [Klebsiella pneumoniae]MCS6640735.1 hypothetical protein [Klebsiella pneumoniae subsp. pneumoniae]
MSEKFQTVSFDLYSSVMGITGLGLVWRAAAKTYDVSALPGEVFLATGLAVFLVLTGIQLLRLVFCRQIILAEWHSRASKNFFCAATISGFLLAMGLLPYSILLAKVLWIAAVAAQIFFLTCTIEEFPYVKIEELASYCNTTPSSITKFVRELGYGSFQELKNDIAPYRLTHQGIKGMTEKEVIEEIYKYIPYEECRKMAEVINNSRSVIILSNSFLFNIANVMRESISSSNRKVYLVERSNNELIKTILRKVDCVFILTLTGQWINSCQYINNVSEKSQLCLISGSVPAILKNKPIHTIELNNYPQMLYANYFSHKYLESIVFNIVQSVI